jgi:hypothetical protein
MDVELFEALGRPVISLIQESTLIKQGRQMPAQLPCNHRTPSKANSDRSIQM